MITKIFKRVLQEKTSILVKRLDEIDIPIEHKMFANSSEMPFGLFMPIYNQQHQAIGLFAIFLRQHSSTGQKTIENMLRKIGALVALAYAYAKTQKRYGT